MGARNAREISCSRPRALESTGSALAMRCRHLRRNWWISRLRYAYVIMLSTSYFHSLLFGLRVSLLSKGMACVVSWCRGVVVYNSIRICPAAVTSDNFISNRPKPMNAPNSPPDKEPAPNKRLRLRSRYLNWPLNCRPSRGTRSTSGRARTGTLARFGVRRGGSLTLV